MSGTLFLLRWQKVVEGYLAIAQDDDSIGEVRPLQIALNQARMARIILH